MIYLPQILIGKLGRATGIFLAWFKNFKKVKKFKKGSVFVIDSSLNN